ncbi:chromatin assembly factor 1 subunit A isoform X1 [Anoplophora glabripennis]|nr:chromatin assembly factor 1 subunit A isoform X1 [Anoplophora glabripennis]
MFGLSVATELFQGSTERTWNCVLHIVHLIWTKLNHIRQPRMPRSRKRHHSRSKSRSKSPSRDRTHERDEKHKKNDSRDKDRDGKRRKIESYDSPPHKRSVSSTLEFQDTENHLVQSLEQQVESPMKHLETVEDGKKNGDETNGEENGTHLSTKNEAEELSNDDSVSSFPKSSENTSEKTEASKETTEPIQNVSSETDKMETSEVDTDNQSKKEGIITLEDSDDQTEPSKEGSTTFKNSLEITPKKVLSPKQVQKKLELEKKRQQRQMEKEEKEKKKQEEKERIKQEKLKKKEEKLKEQEQKQKERELKEEQKKKEKEEKEELKRKEREEKEHKRKEKEEKEEQKRKEREQEKLKKQHEIEEKNKEKQKEEELKQKTAAAFVNFFVPKKSDLQEDKKTKVTQSLAFMEFEVKSDMKLPPARRNPLSETEKEILERYIENQIDGASYIEDLKSGKQIGKSDKTWPFEESEDDDIAIIEDEGNLGETICEDKSKLRKFRAKFLKFHDNRRPAYFGTWRKKSSHVKPRKPFGTDGEIFNYEEDSDDDWEEEEQGESLNGSEDEADKENEDEKDDYEVDNEFFVPHGHLSEDEIDDEESARLSPESLKQKLKLLKDEFDQDMQLKTHKLKPRSIGCIWYNKDGSNVEEAINRYLQPLAMITNGQIQIKTRSEIFLYNSGKKNKPLKELNPEHIPLFLKVVHGNSNNKRVLIEQFMTYMANNGFTVDISKATLLKSLKVLATWRKCKDNGPLKNKFCWLVNEDIVKKYNVSLSSSNNSESDKK